MLCQAILLANSAKLFFDPEGRRKLAGGGARAQPPGQVEEDCSRPGRDAGPEFVTGPILVRRPFRARGPVVRIRWLRFAPPPANIRRASGALGGCQQYLKPQHSKGFALAVLLDHYQANEGRDNFAKALIKRAVFF